MTALEAGRTPFIVNGAAAEIATSSHSGGWRTAVSAVGLVTIEITFGGCAKRNNGWVFKLDHVTSELASGVAWLFPVSINNDSMRSEIWFTLRQFPLHKVTNPISDYAANVVVFGAINIDLLATASVPVTSDDSTPGTLRSYAGGVGRNIAENLTRLGLATTLVSVVGDDEFGQTLLREMQQIGIDVSYVAVKSGASTASYTAVHNNDGELQYAISDMRLFDEFRLLDESALSGEIERSPLQQVIKGADAVVVDANLPESALKEIASCCHSIQIYADGVSRTKCTRLAGVLDRLSLLKVNRAEALALVGAQSSCESGSESSSDTALLYALHKLGPERILLTLGEEGVVYFVDGVLHRADGVTDIRVLSTSGAGDAMLSGFIAAGLAGLSIDDQLQWGNCAAAETLNVYSACSEKLNRQLLRKSVNQ